MRHHHTISLLKQNKLEYSLKLLKLQFGGHWFHSNEVEMAVHKWWGYLNLRQDGTNASMCLGLMLKNNDSYMEEMRTFNTVMNLPLNFYNLGYLTYWTTQSVNINISRLEKGRSCRTFFTKPLILTVRVTQTSHTPLNINVKSPTQENAVDLQTMGTGP